MAGRKKKRGMFGVEAVPWDTPAVAVPLADLRALDALAAGRGTHLVDDDDTFDDAVRDLDREMLAHITWHPVPWPPAEDPRDDDKALGESQAKFDAHVRGTLDRWDKELAESAARPRKKAGLRQRGAKG